MSGTVFGVATRPLIGELVQLLGEHAVFMFADDTAVIIQEMGQLRAAYEICCRFEQATGLALKPTKCVLVPLRVHEEGGEQQNSARYRDALRLVAPGWRDFTICDGVGYLGFRVGPGVSVGDLWRKPLAKYELRTRDMSRGTLAPSACVQYFQQFVAPVLSYVAQLVIPDKRVGEHFEVAVQRLLRVPHRALPKGFGSFLDLVGLRALRPPEETAREARQRTAVRLEAGVQLFRARLQAAREATARLADLRDGAAPVEQRWWRSSAFVDVLWEARVSGPDLPEGRRARSSGRGARGSVSSGRVLEAAVALRPRLRRWFPEARIATALLDRASARALHSVRGCAPTFGVALIRTWTHAWATSQRRGEAVLPFRGCGRVAGDDVRHVVKCATMRAEIARQSGIPPPASLHEALALRTSLAVPRAGRGGRARPPARVMGLTLLCDAYHKLGGAHQNRQRPGSGARRRQVQDAVRTAVRRLWSL